MRQFGATFGVALTVALLGTFGPADVLDHFHHVWWLLVLSGVITSAAALTASEPGRVPQVAGRGVAEGRVPSGRGVSPTQRSVSPRATISAGPVR